MALKFTELAAIPKPSREIDTIVPANVKYDGLTVPVKVVTLVGGRQGMIAIDRYSDFEKTLTESPTGGVLMPEIWKFGAPKNGLSLGYLYNSSELKGNNTAVLDLS